MASEFSNWIDFENAEQCRWAVSYLAKKTPLSIPRGDVKHPSIRLERLITSREWPTVPGLDRILERMERAWNQKVRRENKKREGLVPFTFEMDKKVKPHLTELKRILKRPFSQIVEGLITQEGGAVKELKQALKETRETLKNQRNTRMTENAAEKVLRRNNDKLKKESALLRKEIELQQERIKSLAYQVCKYELLLKSNNISEKSLSPDQEIRINTRSSELLSSYKNSIQADLSEFKARRHKADKETTENPATQEPPGSSPST